MATVLASKAYLGGAASHEVMLGYSDSSRDPTPHVTPHLT